MTHQSEGDPAATDLVSGSPSVELSSNRTSLSFERTRMSADRTLMSIVRTSLSLITFGFTIFEAFHQLRARNVLEGPDAARNFGLALVLLGVLMLIMGIFSHAHFGRELTARRERLFDIHLLRHAIQYRATPTFIIAVLLMMTGLGAAVRIMWAVIA